MDYEKKYKEALEWARKVMQGKVGFVLDEVLEKFPELKESEDERVRKTLKEYFINSFQNNGVAAICGMHIKDILAWLEKQVEISDKIVERARTEKQRILVTESDGVANIDWDTRSLQDAKFLMEYGLNYIKKKLEKQGEQKPADKVKPKFKVGDTMRTLQEAKDGWTDGMPFVVSIDSEYYNCNSEKIAIEDQDEYEFPPMNRKQKPTKWSEEDESLNTIADRFIPESTWNALEESKGEGSCAAAYDYSQMIAMFKAGVQWLKERYTWKPSDEQMQYLSWIANIKLGDGVVEQEVSKHLNELLEDLKKLKGE